MPRSPSRGSKHRSLSEVLANSGEGGELFAHGREGATGSADSAALRKPRSRGEKTTRLAVGVGKKLHAGVGTIDAGGTTDPTEPGASTLTAGEARRASFSRRVVWIAQPPRLESMLTRMPEQPSPLRNRYRRTARRSTLRARRAGRFSMRIHRFDRVSLRHCFGNGIALLALATALATASPCSAESPSLARTISYDAAEVIPISAARSAPAPLSDAMYTAPALTPITDTEIVPADAPCSTCNGGAEEGGIAGSCGGYPYNRCGCSSQLFPWFAGPGACDDWCVGPHWEVALDGLILFRDTIDWGVITPGVGFVPTLADDFDNAPGARVFVTGYNEQPFGLQIGYEGANDFHANALFDSVGATRAISYESRINSIEMNFVRRTNVPWRPFLGHASSSWTRISSTSRPSTSPCRRPLPTHFRRPSSTRAVRCWWTIVSSACRAARSATYGAGTAGSRSSRSAMRGVYLNDFRRREINRTVTTVVTADDSDTSTDEFTTTVNEVQTVTTQEFSELAFVAEAGVTGVLRLSRCVALRGGYQAMYVNGIGTGIDGFLAQGLNSESLLYHGGHFGVEYVR